MTLISLNSLLQILSRTSWLSSATSYCKASHMPFHLYIQIIPPRSSHLGLNVTSSKTCSLSTVHHCTSCLYFMALTTHCSQSFVRQSSVSPLPLPPLSGALGEQGRDQGPVLFFSHGMVPGTQQQLFLEQTSERHRVVGVVSVIFSILKKQLCLYNYTYLFCSPSGNHFMLNILFYNLHSFLTQKYTSKKMSSNILLILAIRRHVKSMGCRLQTVWV